MKIAYLTCVYPPYPGGIGILAQGMFDEMKKRGHQTEVFAPFHPFRPFLRYGNAAFMPQLLWRLRGFDIIHLLYPFFGVAELLPILRHCSKAKIIVHHTMDAVANGWLGALFLFYNKTLMPCIFKQAHQIITLSEDYFRECDLTDIYANFPDAPPIEFVPNGVDANLFCPLRTKKEFPISNFQFPTIVFASGLDRAHYFKGVHVLIEAMNLLKEQGVKCCCKIIGDGNLRKEYENHAQELGLMKTEDRRRKTDFRPPSPVPRPPGETYIEFLGLIPHEQMPRYYQNAAVAVVPSTARVECFSIVAAEAQACGLPVIVSDFPGVRVTIEHNQTGYVVRPGDPEDLANHLKKLFENPQQASAMGARGHHRAVELYSWEKIGDKLEKIYESL